MVLVLAGGACTSASEPGQASTPVPSESGPPVSTSVQPSSPEVVLEFDGASPGEMIALIAVEDSGARTAEWIDRLDGTIRRIDIDDPSLGPQTVVAINVGTDGEQRGLLGQTIIDGTRYAAWTRPADLAGDFELVVGSVDSDSVDSDSVDSDSLDSDSLDSDSLDSDSLDSDSLDGNIVWSAGRAGGGAIGGVLDQLDGEILLGLGRNTEWDAETDVGGAMLRIDPSGASDQEGAALSVGYTNPWAFTVTETGEVWFADNAAGPDPDDPSVDDIERIGRADVVEDRNDVPRIAGPGRAPTSMVELPEGRIGICGFLDNELRAYDIVDSDAGARTALQPAETIMPCNLGVAVFADGTIVTLAQGDNGETLQVLRP